MAALLASAAMADDRYWSNPSGGWFNNPVNWYGDPPPGPGDNAVFDLDSAGYTLSFAASRVSERLYVFNDGVTLDLNGGTWSLQGAFESVVVGYFEDDVALLTVTNGTLAGTEMRIAEDFWAIGTVSVEGGGAVNMLGAVEVGSLGDGLLKVIGGGVVACGPVNVAADTGSVGYLTVSDATSLLDCGGELRVGDFGEAYLEVSNGGQVSVANDVIMARQWASDAYLVVSDANSHLDVGWAVTVGYDGWGAMSVLDGGLLTSAGGSVASGAAAEATVEVAGEGAEWRLTGPLTLGVSGRGMMTVSDGGRVTGATEGVVGFNAGSEGLVKVSGGGSLWSVDGYLSIGRNGDSTGRMRIENGAAVQCANASLAYLGGYGEAVVTGMDSNWDCSGNLFVGDWGEGELSVLDGGRAVTGGFAILGKESGASGGATIRGADSSWDVADVLYVASLGQGALGLYDRAAASCDSAIIGRLAGSVGTAEISGEDTLLEVMNNLHVGDMGDGNMTVSDGARVNCGGLVVGASGTGTGLLTVRGVGALVDVGYALEVGRSGGAGTLRVEDGGLVVVNGAAGVTVRPGSGIELDGGAVLAAVCDLGGGGISGCGTLDADVTGTPDITARGGTLSIGTGDVPQASFTGPGTTLVEPDATLELNWADVASLPGATTLNNGVLLARSGVDLSGGVLDGCGVVVGDVYNGTMLIASPTGTVSLTAPLDVGGSDAAVYSAGTADLGVETTLAGGWLSSGQCLRFADDDVLSGWGVVDADVLLENGVIDAEDGSWISVTGMLDGYGVILGDVGVDPAGFFIRDPTGTVALDGELHVGARDAAVYSTGPARLGWLTTLDGGWIESPGGLTLPNDATLIGSGWVVAEFRGEQWSSIVATGDLDLGDELAVEGFQTDGLLDVGEHTVTLWSFGPARLGGVTILGGGTLAARNCITMSDGAQLRGAGTLAGSLALENALVQAANGESIEITQSLTGSGIVIGDVTARDMTIAWFPTGTVQWDQELTVGSQTAWVYSAGPAELGWIDIAGGTLHAANGLDFAEWSDIDGFGTVDAALSGWLNNIYVEGGTLTLGDASSRRGVEISGDFVEVCPGATMELLDADEAYLDMDEIELDGGVLIARNGLLLGTWTELCGYGVVVGEVIGGLQSIHNPYGPVRLEAPLEVGAETAVVHSAGQAVLSDTHLAGGELRAADGVRFGDETVLSGFGTVEADVTLENAVIDADEGQSIDIQGDLAGCGVVVGQVSADNWSIQNPTGEVELGPCLDVGARTATFYSAGPVDIDSTIALGGGVLNFPVPDSGLLLDDGRLVGFGEVNAPVYGRLPSAILAGGGDLFLGDGGGEAFHTDGLLRVTDANVVIRSTTFANLGHWTDLHGTLTAPGGVALGPADYLDGSGAVDARVAAAAGSTIDADGPLTLGDADALDGFRSDGVMRVGSHHVTLHDRNQAVLAALTTLGDGGGGTLSAANGMLLENGKDLAGYGDINGDFENQGYVLGEGLGLTFHDGVTGSGEFDGNVTFAGKYSPGDSPAVVSFGGNVTFLETAVLEIELAEAGSPDPHDPSYDSLNVAGGVDLDGTLSLSWLPVGGDPNSMFGGTYTILSYGDARSGTFDGIDCAMAAYLDTRLFADGIEYDDANGQVKVHLYDLLDGDADLDGKVGRDDFHALQLGFGAPDPDWLGGDFNLDGSVNFLDYLTWKAHVGDSVPGGEKIPEPSCLALLAAGAAVLLARRRRRWARGSQPAGSR